MCLAVPGKIIAIESATDQQRTGSVSFGGLVREVNLAYVPEATVGDYVMVHVGFALSVVDAREAEAVLDTLRDLDEIRDDRHPQEHEGERS